MYDIRMAQPGEIAQQKEIWKLCFGDPDSFIDFYFTRRYSPEQTLVLLQKNKVLAMLTMLPARIVTSSGRSLKSAILYAIATHPDFQRKGLARRLIEQAHSWLREKKVEVSVLVPAGQDLFDFYRKLGYSEGFNIREDARTAREIAACPMGEDGTGDLFPASVAAYNRIRNQFLRGSLHLAYEDREIDYQKEISRRSGADLYAFDFAGKQGCAAVERISAEQVLLKEILGNPVTIAFALKKLLQVLPAEEYLLRAPVWLTNLSGENRNFAMFYPLGKREPSISTGGMGFFGLAFD